MFLVTLTKCYPRTQLLIDPQFAVLGTRSQHRKGAKFTADFGVLVDDEGGHQVDSPDFDTSLAVVHGKEAFPVMVIELKPKLHQSLDSVDVVFLSELIITADKKFNRLESIINCYYMNIPKNFFFKTDLLLVCGSVRYWLYLLFWSEADLIATFDASENSNFGTFYPWLSQLTVHLSMVLWRTFLLWKSHRKGSNYFNATLSDGTTCRVVCFKESQQERHKQAT